MGKPSPTPERLTPAITTTLPSELKYQTGELNLTITSEKTHVKEGEIFKMQLNLTNIGSQKIRVYQLLERISYSIIFYNYNLISYGSHRYGHSPIYKCVGRSTRILLTDEILVELSPGESITILQDSQCWNLTKGEYNLYATYYTFNNDKKFTKSYWLGSVESNNITIFVE